MTVSDHNDDDGNDNSEVVTEAEVKVTTMIIMMVMAMMVVVLMAATLPGVHSDRVDLFPPFYSWGNGGSTKLSDFLKSIQSIIIKHPVYTAHLEQMFTVAEGPDSCLSTEGTVSPVPWTRGPWDSYAAAGMHQQQLITYPAMTMKKSRRFHVSPR